MVDTKKYAESEYLDFDFVANSSSKIAVILDEAKPEETKFGERLKCMVEIDGLKKRWTMNRQSVVNMQEISDKSEIWPGTKVKFTIKEGIMVGSPLLEHNDKLE
jgi:hypothetical protein